MALFSTIFSRSLALSLSQNAAQLVPFIIGGRHDVVQLSLYCVACFSHVPGERGENRLLASLS